MDKNQLMMLPNIEAEEMMFLQNFTQDLTADQDRNFFIVYQSRRKDPQTIMLVTLLGFIVCAGIQRFMLNQIGMGVLYFFTGGLCLIGTIVDLINFKQMTLEYNKQMAFEAKQLCK
jgi:TM2 domain-containing membrane protein YozV